MSRIVPNIDTIEQHLQCLTSDPERYRPERCYHCGYGKLWGHGYYLRQPDRGFDGDGSLNPVPIPRFICTHPDCGRTCSRLPQCISPRRWYLWAVQQKVLLGLLCGLSLNHISNLLLPARSTLKRWWQWLSQRSKQFQFCLVTTFPELLCYSQWSDYWREGMTRYSLSRLMLTLDRQEIAVP